MRESEAPVMGSELSERITASATEILQLARGMLLAHMRFLDMAVGYLEPAVSQVAPTETVATDGRVLYCNALHIVSLYAKERSMPARAYLHAAMHCVFRHMFVGERVNARLWSLAADIAVENVILELGGEFASSARDGERRAAIAAIAAEVRTPSAEKLYRYFLGGGGREETDALAELFRIDDHTLWYREEAEGESQTLTAEGDEMPHDSDNAGAPDGEDASRKGKAATDDPDGDGGDIGGEESDEGDGEEDGGADADGDGEPMPGNAAPTMTAEEAAELWREISERMQVDLELISKLPGNRAGALVKGLEELHRERYDYRTFLSKFASRTEVMQIDPDEFDYIYYTYGLTLYKNLPLIEPLEYREARRIREFVIAIDTSGSTYHTLVQRFLEKTYNILLESETFDTKVNIHILQCDVEVRDDTVITSRSELEHYLQNLQIQGGGGTDFRPVFTYVDELCRTRELTNLRGLIYLTDGWGAYPKQKPSYETAFVFVEDEQNNTEDVPAWAIKLILDEI